MRHPKIADIPLERVPVSVRAASTFQGIDIATRLVVVALGAALLFVIVRLVGWI